jgi:hypothetical protein
MEVKTWFLKICANKFNSSNLYRYIVESGPADGDWEEGGGGGGGGAAASGGAVRVE